MLRTATAAMIGLSIAACAFGGAFAQTAPMGHADGKMQSAPAQPGAKPSDKDMSTMKMCKGMSKDAMGKDQKCMDMMKMHPDMMKPDSGMMKSAPAK